MEFYNSDIAPVAELELIQFNADRDAAKAVEWFNNEKMPWPVVMRENHKDVAFFDVLGFRSLPSYALVTKDGTLVKKDRNYKALTAEAKRLIAEGGE